MRARARSEADALAYVDLQQFARRNQEANWIFYQTGKRYEGEKKAHGGDRKSEQTKSSGNDFQEPCHLIEKTAEKIAKETGKSERTVRKKPRIGETLASIAFNGDRLSDDASG